MQIPNNLSGQDLEFKFQAIFDYLDHPVYIASPKTYQILYFNKKIEKLVPRIKIGQKCYRALQGLNSPCPFCTNDKLFGENPISPYIWEHYNEKLGKWYHCTDQVILWEGHQKVRFELAVDISELKAKINEIKSHSENLEKVIEERAKELHESEEKFKRIVETTTDVIVVTSFEGKHLYISPQYTKLLGYTEEEANKVMFELIHPDDRGMLVELYKNSIKQKKIMGPEEIEQRWRHKNGHYIWVATISNSYYNNYGEMIGWITSIRDITARKIAEEKKKESEEKYRFLFEKSPFFIILLDSKQRIIDYNLAFQNLVGYQRNELIGKDYTTLSILDQKILPHFLERFEKLLNGEKIPSLEIELIKKDQTKIWVNLEPFLIKLGNDKYNIVMGYEISEKKEAEQLIIKENERLIELNKMRRDLLNRISHELKTPLTSIYGAIQFLLSMDKAARKEKIDSLLKISYRSSIRLKELIDNLMDSSRLDNRKIELNLKKKNISKIVKNCIKELSYIAKSRDLIIENYIPEEIFAEIDKFRFSQVIINILSNAIKNTPFKGLISVQIAETQYHIDISVKDTGVGITDKEKEKLFQKFGKIERYGQNLDVDIEGIGLGLYISKEIIELHGGEILFESEGRNMGSTFIIRLLKKNN